MKKAIEMLRPLFKMEEPSPKGKVVIGTVKGDVHDIGKTIFSIMLQADGFEVLDLGVDVSEEVFVEAVERTKPDILAMSALLTSTISNMKSVLDALEEKGIRKNIKVIVGGRPVTKEYAEQIGADEYGEDAVEGLRKCLSLLN
jgi:5-methyltetrahydrofolate--homocysteine methyltransferase